jgi:hypothetical protein
MTNIRISGPGLEAAAQQFVQATARPPSLLDLRGEQGRRSIDAAQDGEFPEPREDLAIDGGPTGSIDIGAAYRPEGADGVVRALRGTRAATAATAQGARISSHRPFLEMRHLP